MSNPAGAVERAMRAAWAKSWPYVGEVEEWLPLDQHLADTADVAGLLWDDWLAESVRALVAREVGGRDAARRLLRFLAGVHDVGKASPAFAVQVARLSDRMVGTGLRYGSSVVADRSALRHEIAGAAALERWLAARTTLDEGRRKALHVVVAGHHGAYPPYGRVLSARRDLLGDGLWTQVQDALVARADERAGVDWADLAPRTLSVAVQAALTSVVIVADWVASDAFCFPLVDVEHVPDLARPEQAASVRAQEGWRRVAFPRRWRAHDDGSSVDELFAARFPHVAGAPRPMQRAVVETARTMPANGLLLVEAPMGSGKTEAALLAAEVLAARSGASGIFVALPTQATSSAMFTRAHDYLRHVPVDDDPRHTVALVHGKAALNEEAAALPSIRARSVLDDEPDDLRRDRTLRPVAEAWARGRKRAGLAQFVVGTIDQVLFGSLLARHVVVRQLSLIGKVVLIDEVHASDPYMTVYLERALEWLGASGAPVVLLSATLPASKRVALYGAYDRGRRAFEGVGAGPVGFDELDGDIGYPVLIATGGERPRVLTVPDEARSSKVAVERLADDLDALVSVLREALRDGGCVAVVRNTVTRAQRTATVLAAEFGDDVVVLAHSRFLDIDRRANDRRLLAELGPDAARPARRIVVGTQVLEQSLDIDVDLLVTDLAPVDLVLQRMGRLHRHAGRVRPGPLASPRCLVTGVDWSRDVPAVDRGSAQVYGTYSLLASASVLAPHLDGAALELPSDIARLVQRAYDSNLAAPEGWGDDWAAAKRSERESQGGRRKRAKGFLLDPPSGGDLYGVFRGGVGNVDEDSPEGQACVRDSGDSVEVVVVCRDADGTESVPPWVAGDVPLPFRHVPLDDETARLLAGCTVRMPPVMVRDGATAARVISALEQERFEGWDETPLLRRQLALVLGPDLSAEVAEFTVTYDLRAGLTATKEPP